MERRERAIQALRRGVPLGEVVKCSCFTTPPTRNGCFGVCEDSVDAIVASYCSVRNAAIEECAKVLDCAADDWRRIRDPGMANNAASYARKIRALRMPETEEEGAERMDNGRNTGGKSYR